MNTYFSDASTVFKGFADTAKDLGVDLLLQKLVYIACQLGVLLFITHRYARHFGTPEAATLNPCGACTGSALWVSYPRQRPIGLRWCRSRLPCNSLQAA
jgi:hypothetical protein